MSEEIEFDGGAVNDDGVIELEDDYEGDDDDVIDDYANQDEEVDNSYKVKQVENNNDDVDVDADFFDELTQVNNFTKTYAKKKISGYPIVSFIEHTKVYATLCDYISKSKIDVPPEMLDEEEVKTGDAFRISRFWITNRDKYPLPLGISRIVVGNNVENVNINNSLLMEDLDFHDDNNDEHRFHQNFNAKPYDNSC